MKNTVFLTIMLAVALPGTTSAQVQMTYDGGAVIQYVIHVDSSTAADLYKGVDRWIAKTYKAPDKVVKARLENEEIRGDGFESSVVLLSEFPKVINDLRYSFKIEVKDSRIRFTMFDMRGDAYPVEQYIYKKDGTEKTIKQATLVKKSVTDFAAALIGSLEQSLKQKGKSGSDW